MDTTRKVVALKVGLIVINCLLAGTAYASSAMDGAADMLSHALTIIGTLAILQAWVLFYLVRILLTNHKRKTGKDKCTIIDALADQLEKDSDPNVDRILTILKPVVEDYMLRKAQEQSEQTGRPWEDS